MTNLRLLSAAAAIAALGLSSTAIGAHRAEAQPWTWLTEHCNGDACATFRCDHDGCTRIAPYRFGGTDYGYYTDRSYNGYASDNNATRFDRCFGDRCATFRCDLNGDRCTRTGAWRYR
ncbi:MAG TPA: hypothetical protein VGL66_00110 [Caulobacteraceae bacterium]|jgi:hypothetical protein